MTLQACADLLRQDAPDPRVLLIGIELSELDREKAEKFCALYGDAVLPWFWDPGMPSLSATWNRALRFVWETGETKALVANNDVRVTKDTWKTLSEILDCEKALLVTATGVEEEETLFEEAKSGGQRRLAYTTCDVCGGAGLHSGDECTYCGGKGGKVGRGGPGFSLFMISKEAHEKYPFDEELIPAFCEDVDMHRRMILGGDGDRIFGTNVRYLHLGGQTLKAMSPERKAFVEWQIANVSRVHFAKKWGGPVNGETFVEPFGPKPCPMNPPPGCIHPDEMACACPCHLSVARGDVTTPALFDEIRRKW